MAIVPAAMVLLHRADQLYLVKRPPRARFFPDHWVFPGGKADEGETGLEGLRRAAVRELEEEAGVRVAPGLLVPAGRTITPRFSPYRYDAQLFLAPCPPDAEPHFREPELVAGEWVQAGQAVRDWNEGRRLIPPPTLDVLRRMESGGVASLARHGTDVLDVWPEFVPGVAVFDLGVETIPPADHVNCVLIGSRDCILVDPGGTGPDLEAMLAKIRGRVRAIVLTHEHPDHVGGAERAAGVLGAPILAAAETLERGAPDGEAVADGQRLPCDLEAIALITPGHAPGHLAIHVPQRRLVAVGDLATGYGSVLVPPRDRGGSMRDYNRSLERIIGLRPEWVVPGHGPPRRPGTAHLEQVRQHRAKREEAVIDEVRKGARTVDDLLRTAYADTPAGLERFAAANITSLLEDLADRAILDWDGLEARPS